MRGDFSVICPLCAHIAVLPPLTHPRPSPLLASRPPPPSQRQRVVHDPPGVLRTYATEGQIAPSTLRFNAYAFILYQQGLGDSLPAKEKETLRRAIAVRMNSFEPEIARAVANGREAYRLWKGREGTREKRGRLEQIRSQVSITSPPAASSSSSSSAAYSTRGGHRDTTAAAGPQLSNGVRVAAQS